MNYFTNDTQLYFNGKFTKVEAGLSHLYDRTMHYGYGVFEGIRAYKTANGTKIFKVVEHFERLKKSSELLHIPFPYSIPELIEATYETLKQNNLEDAYIRPLVFCGPNMRLDQPDDTNILIAAWNWGAYMGEKLLKVGFSSYCRPHPRSTQIEAKACGHYVNSTLSTIEAKENGYDEALLLDSEGFLAEGAGANLFFQKDGKLFTPAPGNILAGITRQTVIEICQNLNIEVQEGEFVPEDLKNADSAFYCGTAAEVVGFESIDDYKFPLAWENSLGKKIQQAYINLVTENF